MQYNRTVLQYHIAHAQPYRRFVVSPIGLNKEPAHDFVHQFNQTRYCCCTSIVAPVLSVVSYDTTQTYNSSTTDSSSLIKCSKALGHYHSMHTTQYIKYLVISLSGLLTKTYCLFSWYTPIDHVWSLVTGGLNCCYRLRTAGQSLLLVVPYGT